MTDAITITGGSPDPASHVLVIQHTPSEPTGILGDALQEAGLRERVVRPFDNQPILRDLGSAAGLVVMGGPMGVYEGDRYPHLVEELRLIEWALAADIPVIGVCLGSQLLATALGAEVKQSGYKEIGWHHIQLATEAVGDPLFGGSPVEFMGFHWHGDVFDLPAGAVALASSDRTPVQAFRHGSEDSLTYGLLFHLEVTRPIIEGMVTAFAGELNEAKIDGQAILTASSEYLLPLQQIGRRVFGQWANAVAVRGR